jgi:uncharacterized integral membrane protein
MEQPGEPEVIHGDPVQIPSWRRRWAPRLVVWTIILALSFLFVVQNFDRVSVRIIAWDVELQLAWALLIAGAFGFVLGLLLPLVRRNRS